MIDLQKTLSFAKEIVSSCSERILNAHSAAVQEKAGHYNYVTETDIAVEEYLKAELSALIPGCCFYAEEQENSALTDAYTWVVDPIDGTMNFIANRHASCVSVALLYEKSPVLSIIHQPYLNEFFTAIKGQGAFLNDQPIRASSRPFEKALTDLGTSPYYAELASATAYCFHQFLTRGGDIRRVGSAALDCCDIACGRADIFCELRLSPWDYAAGALLITEAGGRFMMPFEEKPDFSKATCILATNPLCEAQALAIVREAQSRIVP